MSERRENRTMNLLKWVKDHAFLCFIGAAYVVMALWHKEIAIGGLVQSQYYIKEMLMIMPVIFILTALLDTWVPRETILKALGGAAGAKGAFFAFVLGSISAGPIYAAFPFCAMLIKKGASVRNIVIILSAWAVIKVPMLVNEAKFLGLNFTGLRWIFTILAIWSFSWIMARVVKEDQIKLEDSAKVVGLTVVQDACMGCGLCARRAPGLFEMRGKKAIIVEGASYDLEQVVEVVRACPVKAIEV